jgi:hypothetical protein
MTEPVIRTPFGEIVPARDGACGRRDVAVAWGIVVVVAAAFIGLSVGAQLPAALTLPSGVVTPTVGAVAL